MLSSINNKALKKSTISVGRLNLVHDHYNKEARLVIPTLGVEGAKGFGFSLIYNEDTMGQVDGDFGKNTRLSVFKEFDSEYSTWFVKGSDNFEDTFEPQEKNIIIEETTYSICLAKTQPLKLYVSADKLKVRVVDSNETHYIFERTNTSSQFAKYPSRIERRSGVPIYFQEIENGFRYSNNLLNKIEFIKESGSNYVTRINVYNENTLTGYSKISYLGTNISKIQMYYVEGLNETLVEEYEINLLSSCSIKDTITNETLLYEITVEGIEIRKGINLNESNKERYPILYLGKDTSYSSVNPGYKVNHYYENRNNLGFHLYDADALGNVTLSNVSSAGYTTFSNQLSFNTTLSGNENLLLNGDFSDGTSNWNVDDDEITIFDSDNEGDPIVGVCSKKALIKKDSQIYQSVITTILPNEGVRLAFFYKDGTGLTGSTLGFVKMTVFYDDGISENKIVNLIAGEMKASVFSSSPFGLKVVEVVSPKAIKRIDITVKSEEGKTFYVKGLFLTKGAVGKTYTYDDQNRVTAVKSLNETRIYCDDFGNVLGMFSSNKDFIEYKYGENNNLLEAKDSLGNLSINNYDSEYFDNVIRAVTYFDDKYIQVDKTYNNSGRDVRTETDVYNQVTTYDVDSKTRLLDSVLDPLNIHHSYLYNDKKLLTQNSISKNGEYSNVSITYYPSSSVKEYINGNLKYLFTYNNEGKIKKVEKININENESEQLVFVYYDYELDSTKLISNNIAKIINRSGLFTSFEYDLFGNVTKITRGTRTFVYEYDALQRTIRNYETNSSNAVINPISYVYNIRNQIVQVNQADFIINYTYDEEGKLKTKEFGKPTRKYVEKFNHLQSNKKNLYHNKKSLYEYNGYGCFFDKSKKTGTINEKLKNTKGEEISPSSYTISSNGKFNYLNCTSSTRTVYSGLTLKKESKVSLALSFKVLYKSFGGLFCLKFDNNVLFYGEIDYIEDEDITWLNIYAKEGSNVTLLHDMVFDEFIGRWASMVLTYDKETGLSTFACENELTRDTFVCESSLVGTNASLYLGCLNLRGTPDFWLSCQFSKVIVAEGVISDDDMQKMINESNYLMRLQKTTLNDENNANYASSLTLKDCIYTSAFPLNYSLSNKDREILKIHNRKEGVDLFEYNQALKDYAFNAKGNVLTKELTDTTCLTAIANVYFDTTDYNQSTRQIFGVDDGNSQIDFFRNTNKKLCIRYKGSTTETPLVLEDKVWATVSLCIEEVLTSDSLDVAYYNFRVTLNNVSYSTQISTGSDYSYTFSSFNVYVGGDQIYEDSIMNGNISDLYLTNVKLSMDEIENFMNEKETIVYHESDSLGNIIEEGIKTRNRTITKKAYEYKMDGNRCLGKISKVIQDNEEILVEMDGLNNITKLGNMTYTYDYLNRLTRASGNGSTTDYQYDELGNLYLKVKNGQATTFTYDNDKLLSYGGNTLVYDDHNRIIGLGTLTLSWNGELLTNVSFLENGTFTTYTYEYDVNGLRTKKSKGASVTNYTYEGDLLVKQEDGINEVHYLYDENSMLYGLIWNDEKYFYKRNLIGEISDIIDFNGNSVVKYSYDPFGKVESVTGSKASTLGVINSMLYKGYYYDVETQLFYCNSRYYSPELCRWISLDSIEYLDSESIKGLNLYAYCGNDPVSKYDPSGHFAISILAWIIIGAALTTAGVIIYGAVTDTPVVLDISVTIPIKLKKINPKVGFSFVFDFKNKNVEGYFHIGGSVGFLSPGLGYSVGIIENYKNPGDYAEHFTNVGVNIGVGIEHCFDPTKPYSSTVKATTITFSTGNSAYVGYDYYWQMF